METLSLERRNHKNSSIKRQLVVMTIFGMLLLFVFHYIPMIGILISFKEGDGALNILSILFDGEKYPWSIKNYVEILTSKDFWAIMKNTLGLNLLSLLINFPAPIIFALLLNEVKSRKAKNAVQTIATFPHFISWVIFGGIIQALTDQTTGIINPILKAFGIIDESIDLNLGKYFWAKMIIVSLLKNVGWGSIIYSAAIVSINPSVYEAAKIEGANRFQCAIKITLPLILPTVTTFLLLNLSRILGNSFEQFYIFQSAANLDKSEVLATYVYSQAFTYRNYSTAAAVSFFEGVVSVVLLTLSNKISKVLTGNGILK